MSPSSTSLSTRFGTVAVPNILLFQGAKPMARFNHTDRTLDTLTSFLVNQTGTNAGYVLHYIELTGLGSKGSELGGWKNILSHVKWIWTTTQMKLAPMCDPTLCVPGFEAGPDRNVTDVDRLGPLPSVPVRSIDWLLVFSILFITSFTLYAILRTDSIRWLIPGQEHEHQDWNLTDCSSRMM